MSTLNIYSKYYEFLHILAHIFVFIGTFVTSIHYGFNGEWSANYISRREIEFFLIWLAHLNWNIVVKVVDSWFVAQQYREMEQITTSTVYKRRAEKFELVNWAQFIIVTIGWSVVLFILSMFVMLGTYPGADTITWIYIFLTLMPITSFITSLIMEDSNLKRPSCAELIKEHLECCEKMKKEKLSLAQECCEKMKKEKTRLKKAQQNQFFQ